MDDGDGCLSPKCKCWLVCIGVLAISLLFGFGIFMTIDDEKKARNSRPPPLQDPMFTVESTSVKSHNATTLNNLCRLITVIDLGIRVRNPNPTNSCYFFDFREMTVHVKKGRKEVAQADLMDFGLCSGNETLIHVEAVGVDDMTEGSRSAMNVSLSGRVGVYGSFLDVMCVDVGVQKVDCDVKITVPMPHKLPPCNLRSNILIVNYCALYHRDVQLNGTIELDPDESKLLECS